MLCVYCGSSDLSDEHWFPRAFGVFKGYELLKDRVCTSCNGKTKLAEQALARYGMTGLYRLKLGIQGRKRKKEESSSFYKGLKGIPPIKLLIWSPGHECEVLAEIVDAGKLCYARQILARQDGKLVPILIPDTVRDRSEFEKLLKGKGLLDAVPVWLIAHGDEFEMLKEFASVFPNRPEKEPHLETPDATKEEPVTIQFVIDELQVRAVCKIAFHYFLKFWGCLYTGAEEEFAPIRRFIMGELPETDWRRFATHTKDGMQVMGGVPAGYGHLFALGRDERQIQARLMFFVGPDVRPWTWRVNLGRPPGKIISTDLIGHYLRYFEKPETQYHGEILDVPLVANPKVWFPQSIVH